MGALHVYAIFGMILSFSALGSVVVDCDWRRNFLNKADVFFVVATHLFCKSKGAISTKKSQCRLLFLENNFKHMTAGFALFTVVDNASSFPRTPLSKRSTDSPRLLRSHPFGRRFEHLPEFVHRILLE